jgi:DNA polymerase beta
MKTTKFPNQKIINEFEKLVDQVKYDIDNLKNKKEVLQNTFRLRQLKNAIDIIKKINVKINEGSDIKDIKGIGNGTIRRIDEILEKGNLKEIKVKKYHLKYEKYIADLQLIFGIGRKTAFELVRKHNIKNIKQLKKAHMTGKIKLTEQMMISLKHHSKYRQQIPRKEIDTFNKKLQIIIKSIDKNLNAKICGSFRREKDTSNDIDILITHPKIKTKNDLLTNNINYLNEVVKVLTNKNIIIDDLTYDEFKTKYMGYMRLSTKHFTRRIDIYYMPYQSYPASLLHLTGSGEFNQKMRSLAISLGFKLNEYGLFKRTTNKKTKEKTFKIINIKTEKDIFKKLGMDYVEPKLR